MCLTAAGEALVRHARSVLDGLAAAQAEVDAITALDVGRLRIGTYSSVGATLVVQAVAAFRQRHPGVRITLRKQVATNSSTTYEQAT